MVETEKILVSIRDAMNKRPRKVKASSKSISEDSKGPKQIPFAQLYKKKLMEKLNRKKDEPSP